MKMTLIVLAINATSIVFAGSLQDKKALKELEESVSKSTAEIKQACGAAPKVEIAEASKVASEAHKAGQSLTGRVEDLLGNLRSLCEKGADEKAAINEIKNVKISFGAKEKKIQLKKSGSSLTIGLNWETSNVQSDSADWLKDNL